MDADVHNGEVPRDSVDDRRSRQPGVEDLLDICRELNRLETKYVVVGGFAIRASGYPRETGDIDLVVATDLENESRVFKALEVLPDQAVRELDAGDVGRHIVVRVADEVVVDLMQSAAGIEYAEAAESIVVHEIEGVPIPFASPRLLWRMKARTHRAKDEGDLFFLRQLFASNGEEPPEI